MSIVIYIHNRDLRRPDNRGLEAAAAWAKAHGARIAPVFIFTPAQVGARAPIRSPKSVACMLHGLVELEKSYNGTLGFYYGDTLAVLKEIAKEGNVGAIFTCADYTPYARARESTIGNWCAGAGIHFQPVDDIYLHAPGKVLNKAGKPFQKFTPFYEKAILRMVDHPRPAVRGPFVSQPIKNSYSVSLDQAIGKMGKGFLDESEGRAYKGGRAEGLKLISKIPENYADIHDMLPEKTSGLSVHNHYGTVSIREVYWKTWPGLGAGSRKHVDAFIRQLYWRDFYGHVMAAFESLYGVSAYDFQTGARYESLSASDAAVLKAWKEGKTGVPLVDAAMRQMNETGFMHNRARLVVASWLIKDKGIWWRHGERYFAERLLDYDFTQNMLNWCWVASVLPFSQAPFRRHDPERIAERLDPEGVYVRRWLGDREE
jgi:deoxyribodipyrimidine photo-lyase